MVKMEMIICQTQSKLCLIQNCSPVMLCMGFLVLGGPEHLVFEQL